MKQQYPGIQERMQQQEQPVQDPPPYLRRPSVDTPSRSSLLLRGADDSNAISSQLDDPMKKCNWRPRTTVDSQSVDALFGPFNRPSCMTKKSAAPPPLDEGPPPPVEGSPPPSEFTDQFPEGTIPPEWLSEESSSPGGDLPESGTPTAPTEDVVRPGLGPDVLAPETYLPPPPPRNDGPGFPPPSEGPVTPKPPQAYDPLVPWTQPPEGT